MVICMRTTVNLDDALLREAKAEAARAGRTLTSLIEEGLRQALAQRARPAKERAYQVKTFHSPVRPGVDLDNNGTLLELMGRE